jgi:hypothetical protein
MICPNCRAAADLHVTTVGNAAQMTQVADELDRQTVRLHADCKGSTWCDCQHRTIIRKVAS